MSTSSTRSDFSRLVFLIVDDNVFTRRMVKAILSALNCREVHEAEDGSAAIEAIRGGLNPDVVFTDWVMPELDGIELTEWIRTDEGSPDVFVPIIMISARSEADRILEAMNAGVTEFLIKPLSARGVHSRLVSVVDNPRPFVRSGSFFGPDRRRRTDIAYKGVERRLAS